jgi:hypothetical protein
MTVAPRSLRRSYLGLKCCGRDDRCSTLSQAIFQQEGDHIVKRHCCLFLVSEASDSLAVDEVVVSYPDVDQSGRTMTDRGDDTSALIDGCGDSGEPFVVRQVPHGAMTTGVEDGAIALRIHLVWPQAVVQRLRPGLCVDETPADLVHLLGAARIHGRFTAPRADEIHRTALVYQHPVRVTDLGEVVAGLASGVSELSVARHDE